MFKKALAIVLMVCTLAANFSRLFVFAGFELNKNYIASTLCENRDKPWLHCNGRCYFMKKIHQAEEKEKSAGRETQKNLFQDVYYNANIKISFNSYLLQEINSPYMVSAQQIFPSKFLRPPQTA